MLRAVAALWTREVVKFVRDRSRLVGALAQPLGFWVLLGLGFGGTFRMPGAEASVPYLEYLYPGIVALILLFTAIFSTISVVEERQQGFLQAALVAPVPRAAIVLGNVLGGTTLALAQAALFLLLAPLVGLAPSLAGLGIVAAAAVPTALAFTALGFVIAWRLETTRGFHAVMNLFLLPMWFLSGAFFPAEGAPAVLRALMYANPAFYGVSALRQGLYWPAEAPGAGLPLGLALGVSALFALLLLGLATLTVRRPLFGR
ncbi:MAG TPA: ABC transporter permease [Rubricoccaceae bacterium]|nr:ABC transporter permease [Rubricoccaceae bacterium]